jgi:lipopolysaccharide/colanic/teichoic acid biosynthesis glycosyltransferase
MYANSDKIGSLTIGSMDPRVTRVGYFLRKFKFDELPQLVNVLKGDMSIVGPRPEVRKYVELYSDEQYKVLSVPPGITDLSSIVFRNENELLSMADYPENHYITEIMPEKLKLSLIYIRNKSIGFYFRIILITITSILGFNTISKILIGRFIKGND